MSDQHFSHEEQRRRDIPSFIEPRPPLITHPLLRPRPQKGTNLLELFEEDMESEEPELLQVYLRLKPSKEVNDLYEVRSDKCLITSLDTTTAGHGRRTQHNVSKMYTFSKIFGPESTQKDIFEAVVKDNLKKLPEGQSFTLLTYGASGSGKTYTLMGTVHAPGLVPRSLEYVFKLIDASQLPSYKPAESGGDKLSYAEQEFELQWVKTLRQVSVPLRDKYRRMSTHLNSYMSVSSIDLTNRKRHYVWVSFVEIYNEAIYDLLSPPEKRTKLRIREDSSGNVYVKGATQAFVRSGEEAYDVMVAGKHNLVVASTGIHAHSSRSHCIFTITMLTETEKGIRSSCVRLCDLAGCERARATGNTGTRMAESRAINSSLHVLERCLHSLHRLQRLRQRQNHRTDSIIVPYRESKLTRLLGSGLSGSQAEGVSMVVTLNPAARYANETKHVLSLAAVAQDLQVNNTVLTSTFGSSIQEDASSIDCTGEVMRLRAENERLHYELALAHSRNKDLTASFEDYRQKMSSMMSEVVQETKDIERLHYEAEIKSLKDEMSEMIEEYESRLSENSSAPVVSNSEAQRCTHNKITELMAEIAVLEEKLTAERLARAQAENEMEYLRKRIDETEEITCRDNELGHQDDVVSLSPSEDESDDETVDPLDESLEPVFKVMNLNRTQQRTINIQQSISEECADNESDDASNSTEDNNPEVIYASDDDNASCKKNNDRKNSSEKIQNITTEITRPDDIEDEQEEQFHIEDSSILQPRETSKEEISESSYVVENENLQKLNLQRGSYCIATNTELPEDSFDIRVKENSENDFNIDNDKIITVQLPENSSHENIDKPIENGTNDAGVDKDKRKADYETELLDDYPVIGVKENLKSSADDLGPEKDETNLNCKRLSAELSNNSFVVKTIDNLQTRSTDDDFTVESDKIMVNNIELTVPKNKSKTLVNEIIESFKTNQCGDDSLSQFEQLEIATKACHNDSEDKLGDFGEIKIHMKEKKNYFDDSIDLSSNKFNNNIKLFNKICKPLENKIPNKDPNELIKIKQLYFNNTATSDCVETAKNKIVISEINSDSITGNSASSMRNECNDIEPSVNKKLFAEEVIKSDENLSSTDKNTNNIYNDSLDVFDEQDSSIILKPNNVMSNVEKAQKSIEKLVLNQNSNRNVKSESKLDTIPTVEEIKNSVKQLLITETKTAPMITNESVPDNKMSIDDFDNIFKSVTPRATEFDLLFAKDTSSNLNGEQNNDEENEQPVQLCEYITAYGLRNRVITKTLRRNLRLRKRKDQNGDEDGSIDKDEIKLKDIGNLQREFSDITVNVPVARKDVVKDLNTTEKVFEEENVPPEVGIRSCPSKSVTRSRRKLFTPQVEPLEESLGHTGDSNERIRIPRPSYRRGKARRKL